MVNLNKDIVRDGLFSLGFLAWAVIALFVLPKLFLLAGGGIEQEFNLTKFFFYTAPGIGAAIILVVIKLIRSLTKAPYVDSILHDPEKSIIDNVPFIRTILHNPFLLILGSLIFFSSLVYLGKVSQSAFFPSAAIPDFPEQQITETAEIGLTVYPASFSETTELVLLITIMIIVLNFLKHKYKLDPFIYNGILYFIIPLIGMSLWGVYHQARYGSEDVKLLSTLMFGWITSFITIVTRSIIPALVYHDVNNFYAKTFILFSSDIVLTITLVLIILMLIAFVYLLINSVSSKDHKHLG